MNTSRQASELCPTCHDTRGQVWPGSGEMAIAEPSPKSPTTENENAWILPLEEQL